MGLRRAKLMKQMLWICECFIVGVGETNSFKVICIMKEKYF